MPMLVMAPAVALVLVHLTVTDPPTGMLEGLTKIWQVGGGVAANAVSGKAALANTNSQRNIPAKTRIKIRQRAFIPITKF